MNRFVEMFNNLVVQSGKQVYDFFAQYGPGMVFALLVILFGWVCAVLVKKIISKLLRALGFDVLSEKFGLRRFLERGEVKSTPSVLMGLVFYWIIILNAFIVASDAVDLKLTSKFIERAVLYLPVVITVGIFFMLALLLSGAAAKVVEKTARAAKVSFYKILAILCRYTILGAAVMIILEYLEVPVYAVQICAVILLILPVVFLAIILITGKDIFLSILARRYYLEDYKEGDEIIINSISGKIEKIGLFSTRLSKGSDKIIIPNSEFSSKIVMKKGG